MRFDPDKNKKITAYIASFLPVIVSSGFLLANYNQPLVSYHLICWFIFLGFTLAFLKATGNTFSYSLMINSNLIYLTSEKVNARLSWDRIREVNFSSYSWLNLKWLFFVGKNNGDNLIIAFRLFVLSSDDEAKILAYVKRLAEQKSIKINY